MWGSGSTALFRIHDSELRKGSWLCVEGLGFWVLGLGFRVEGLGFRV